MGTVDARPKPLVEVFEELDREEGEGAPGVQGGAGEDRSGAGDLAGAGGGDPGGEQSGGEREGEAGEPTAQAGEGKGKVALLASAFVDLAAELVMTMDDPEVQRAVFLCFGQTGLDRFRAEHLRWQEWVEEQGAGNGDGKEEA